MKLTQRIIYCFFPITGLICIFFSDHVTAVLPYLLGGTMLAVGALRTMICIHPREHSAQSAGKLAQGLILSVVGIMFVFKGENAIGAVGTVWAIIGIRKAAQSLDQTIQLCYEKQSFLVSALTFAVRMALALVLLFNPFEKFSAHVMILGFEIIVSSIRFSGKRFHIEEQEE